MDIAELYVMAPKRCKSSCVPASAGCRFVSRAPISVLITRTWTTNETDEEEGQPESEREGRNYKIKELFN